MGSFKTDKLPTNCFHLHEFLIRKIVRISIVNDANKSNPSLLHADIVHAEFHFEVWKISCRKNGHNF